VDFILVNLLFAYFSFSGVGKPVLLPVSKTPVKYLSVVSLILVNSFFCVVDTANKI
jgi:hypothetical protein